MIVICKKGTTQEQIDQFTHWLHDQGMEVHLSRGTQTTLLGLVGDTSSLDAEQLASLPFVERVQRISEPYKKANRKFHPEDTVVDVSGRKLGGGHFCMIAGPCSVESAEQITEVAQAVKELSEAVNLEEAKVIVTGGRGMGSKEQFALVEELAALLGGVVGATRPAIEDGWVSRAHQVGQSGKIVAPALYIACGVSGATQHVSGMSGSGYVVAINKDEDAPIFDVADVGIVGDVAKVLPLMIEEIRQRKAE